jgi:hypothetical protein
MYGKVALTFGKIQSFRAVWKALNSAFIPHHSSIDDSQPLLLLCTESRRALASVCVGEFVYTLKSLCWKSFTFILLLHKKEKCELSLEKRPAIYFSTRARERDLTLSHIPLRSSLALGGIFF